MIGLLVEPFLPHFKNLRGTVEYLVRKNPGADIAIAQAAVGLASGQADYYSVSTFVVLD
jgi:hypothetical protein